MARAHRLETAAGCEMVDHTKYLPSTSGCIAYQFGKSAGRSRRTWAGCGTLLSALLLLRCICVHWDVVNYLGVRFCARLLLLMTNTSSARAREELSLATRSTTKNIQLFLTQKQLKDLQTSLAFFISMLSDGAMGKGGSLQGCL